MPMKKIMQNGLVIILLAVMIGRASSEEISLTNAGFESGTLGGWGSLKNTTVSDSTAGGFAHTGTYSAKLDDSPGYDNGICARIAQYPPGGDWVTPVIAAGDVVTLSMWIYHSSQYPIVAGQGGRIVLNFVGATSGWHTVQSEFLLAPATAKDVWVPLEFSATVPAGDYYLVSSGFTLQEFAGFEADGGSVYVDDVTLTAGPPPPPVPDDAFLYPVPRNISYGAGTAVVSNGNFNAPAALSSVVTDKVKDIFSAYAGITLIDGTVALQVKFTQNAALHDQGYSLDISAAGGVEVSYKDDAGAFHAAATLKQLLFQNGANLPYLTITDDYPDFPNRGFMWDISRNKIPTVATIKRVIDIMADLKLNQLQLYIEGYPFAYASYPDVWAGGTPLTPADFKEIDAYCAERFIEFVPNQNSYGHMYKWLALPQFDGIKEVPGKANASTIALTNPDAITFLNNLYTDLLPNFTSDYFNIGGDETKEVGTGQSLLAYPDFSTEEIYLEGLKSLHSLVAAKNKKMMFWADMIIKYSDSNPAIVQAAKEALPNAIALNWGYEFDYDFASSTAKLKGSGFPFYVCPGSASWASFVGRTSNMTENLEDAAFWGRVNGAIGYLLTSWGDYGHHQQLVFDYPALAYAAGLSWSYDNNRKTQVDYNSYLSRFVFQDGDETLSSSVSALADYGSISPRCWNKSWIHHVFSERYTSSTNLNQFINFQSGSSTAEKQANALSQAEQVSVMAQDFLISLDAATINAADAAIVRAELENGAKMLSAAAEYTAMRLRMHNGVTSLGQENSKAAQLHDEYGLILSDFENIWLLRNSQSELMDTLTKLSNPVAYYRYVTEWAGWQAIHFTQQEITDGLADASQDADGDGMTNEQEFIAGLNPRDSASVFSLQIPANSGGEFALAFDSATGRIYSIHCCTNLLQDSWEQFGPSLLGTGQAVLIEVTNEWKCTYYRAEACLP